MRRQLRKTAKRALAEVVFDALDVGKMVAVVESTITRPNPHRMAMMIHNCARSHLTAMIDPGVGGIGSGKAAKSSGEKGWARTSSRRRRGRSRTPSA